MIYTKPAIAELSNAVEAIRGSADKQIWCFELDGDLIHFNAVFAAYEADE